MNKREYEDWQQQRSDDFGHKFIDNSDCEVVKKRERSRTLETDRKFLFDLINKNDLEIKKVSGMDYCVLIELDGGFAQEIPDSRFELGNRETYQKTIEAIVGFLDDVEAGVI